MFNSGVFDKNNKEICEGDRIKIVINHMIGRPTIAGSNVQFIRGAFRFVRDDGMELSCIGDLSCNCEIEVIENYSKDGLQKADLQKHNGTNILPKAT